jgi:adenine-specific DNA-methyltransferase
VFIEGDNLEVLKLLQKAYFGRIKMIYIDPPYNTGKEFIYPDKYAETLETYLEYTGQKDNDGRKFATNTDSSGRFHSRWLNMMYPRLYLAKNLLTEDGIIFITIDDNELANLKLLCDQVFGQERFFACLAWQAKDTAGNDAKGIATVHNYVLAYTKSPEFEPNLFARTDKQIAYYKNPDNDPRGPWLAVPLTRGEYRERDHYALRNPVGEEVWPPAGNSWRRPPSEIEKLQADGRIWWGTKGDSQFPSIKAFLSEVKEGTTPISWWDYKFAGSTRRARSELKELFEGERGFDTPKPTLLVSRMLELATSADEPDIVLDFFAGSSTTADAVLRRIWRTTGSVGSLWCSCRSHSKGRRSLNYRGKGCERP